MRAPLKVFICATVALLLSACSSQAATIIKLDLGGTGPDLNYTGGVFGTLNTTSDGNLGTTGDQNTAILFTSFLSSLPATTGSYSLAAATATGAPTPLGGGVVTQNFSGGNFKIYNSTNALLLDVKPGYQPASRRRQWCLFQHYQWHGSGRRSDDYIAARFKFDRHVDDTVEYQRRWADR